MPKPNPSILEWTLNEIESSLKQLGQWQSEPIDPAKVQNINAAFGADQMTFFQWLQFVLLPNVRKIAAEGGAFPSESNVAAYAVRELDGMIEAADLITHLAHFDSLFNDEPDEFGLPKWMKETGR